MARFGLDTESMKPESQRPNQPSRPRIVQYLRMFRFTVSRSVHAVLFGNLGQLRLLQMSLVISQ